MTDNGAHGHEQHHGDTYSAARTAEVLGLGKRRVLQMLERGDLPGTKDKLGRWHVPVPPVDAMLLERQQQDRRKRPKKHTPGSSPEPEPTSELHDRLKDEITFLREELRRRDERHAEEIRRRDHLLAAALERIPELEAPRDAPRARVKAAEKPPKGTAPEPRPTPQTGTQRRPWWVRILGG